MKKYGEIYILIESILLFLCGFYLLIENKAIVGTYQLTQQGTAIGGGFIILIGIITLIVYWNSISPFSPIKKIFRNRK